MKVVQYVVVGILGFAIWSTPAGAFASCTVRNHAIPGVANSREVRSQRDAIVYAVGRPEENQTFWACSRANGRRVLLGHKVWEATNIPSAELSDVHVAGNLVTAVQYLDPEPECGKYDPTEKCPASSTVLVVANVAIGLSSGERWSLQAGEKWFLSPQGAVAWLEWPNGEAGPSGTLYGCFARVVHGKITCPVRTVWSGPVGPKSVRLSGRTLRWTAGRRALSAVL
jgi:hypothetical protein